MLVELPAGEAPSDASAAPPRRRWIPALVPYLYLAPAVAVVVAWTYQPLLVVARLSFLSWNLLPTQEPVAVGWDNYKRLIELPEVSAAALRTLVVIAGLLPFTIVAPLGIALLVRAAGPGAGRAYQAMVFAPMMIAPVASAAVWRWILDPRSGLANDILGTDRNWVYDTATALGVVIVITGWHLIGFALLIMLAGLAGITQAYPEAARVDGATAGQIRRWIILPLLSPTLLFLVLMTILLSAQWTFPVIDSLTQGGPAGSTTNIYYALWDYSFRSFDAGLAAAAGVVLFVVFGAVALVLVWLIDKASFHDD